MLKTKAIVVGDVKVSLYLSRPIAANTAESKGYGARSVVMYDNYGFGWFISGDNGSVVEDVYGPLEQNVASAVLALGRQKTVFNAVVKRPEDKVFSNFASAPIMVDGIIYPTVEHAYQAMKTLDNRERILMSLKPSAGKAKLAGRQIILRKDWEKVRLPIMTALEFVKFSNNEEYRKVLLGTGSNEIIEDASAWDDMVWGIGKDGRGNNLLGTALMIVRRMLKNDVVPDRKWFSVLNGQPGSWDSDGSSDNRSEPV